MKKLVFALVVAYAAVTAQAASYSWRCVVDGVYLPGQDTDYYSGTAYLIDAAINGQSDFLAAIRNGGDITGYQIATATLAGDDGFQPVPFTYDGQAGGSTWNGYMAVLTTINKEDVLFISDLTDLIQTPSDQSMATISIKDPSSASATAVQNGDFNGSGWYSVPEPTSGLLVLMGLAGLMLRRKRA